MSASVIEVSATTIQERSALQFDYDAMISDPADREWAESAAGFITFGLGKAVVKVLEAGNLLREAKQRLPHGEFLPWVEQACGLKPRYAQQLIRAAEWANAQHAAHLNGVADATTLFLLSADATPDDVREWFMERCAAGDVPSRAEVAERKRASRPGAQRQPRPVERRAVDLIRRGQLQELREALALAESAQIVTAADVLAEVQLRELPKGSLILGIAADFHRQKDGSWIRLPHSGRVDAPVAQPVAVVAPVAEPVAAPAVTDRRQMEIGIDRACAASTAPADAEVVLIAEACARMGYSTPHSLKCQLTPSGIAKRGKPLIRNGWQAEPHPKRGHCLIRRVA